jgi:hypothetical protein
MKCFLCGSEMRLNPTAGCLFNRLSNGSGCGRLLVPGTGLNGRGLNGRAWARQICVAFRSEYKSLLNVFSGVRHDSFFAKEV